MTDSLLPLMNRKTRFPSSADWGKFTSIRNHELLRLLCPRHHPKRKTFAFPKVFLTPNTYHYLPCSVVSFRQKIQICLEATRPHWQKLLFPNEMRSFFFFLCLYSLAKLHFPSKLHLQNGVSHIHGIYILQITMLTQDCWSQYSQCVTNVFAYYGIKITQLPII